MSAEYVDLDLDPSRPRITYLAKRLESAVRRHLDLGLQELGLTTPQYAALSVLRSRPGLSSAQLARRAFVTPQSMQVMIAAFVRAGLVERQAHPDNHRILRNYLTDTGQAVLQRCEEIAARVEERMLTGLGEGQVLQLRDVLQTCVGNLAAGRPGRRT